MIWVGIAVAAVAIAVLLVIAIRRRGSLETRTRDDVDPLFTAGIAITGAGVALATTVGTVMYVVMIVGLIVMAIGANRTRHPHH